MYVSHLTALTVNQSTCGIKAIWLVSVDLSADADPLSHNRAVTVLHYRIHEKGYQHTFYISPGTVVPGKLWWLLYHVGNAAKYLHVFIRNVDREELFWLDVVVEIPFGDRSVLYHVRKDGGKDIVIDNIRCDECNVIVSFNLPHNRFWTFGSHVTFKGVVGMAEENTSEKKINVTYISER